MRRGLLVVVGFVAITIVLTWLWTHGGQLAYGRFLKAVAPPLYDVLGFEGARVGAFRERYINWIPFVGLVLVTPGLSLRRRGIGLLVGLALMPVCHLALNLTELIGPRNRLPFVPSLVSDTLPFLLWLVIAWPVVGRWFEAATAAKLGGSEPPPIPPAETTDLPPTTDRARPSDRDEEPAP